MYKSVIIFNKAEMIKISNWFKSSDVNENVHKFHEL